MVKGGRVGVAVYVWWLRLRRADWVGAQRESGAQLLYPHDGQRCRLKWRR